MILTLPLTATTALAATGDGNACRQGQAHLDPVAEAVRDHLEAQLDWRSYYLNRIGEPRPAGKAGAERGIAATVGAEVASC